ncbi:hypothetical protein JZ751_015144 [Albula glossodonta]|uniref:Uncharacterized protein n=1 Tax=Albula glossodonta TaxID=121402 RepID=A0A8T2NZU6_9TELE|nr:hypothetical protein JZ751_015144 [Albula glossodonta]
MPILTKLNVTVCSLAPPRASHPTQQKNSQHQSVTICYTAANLPRSRCLCVAGGVLTDHHCSTPDDTRSWRRGRLGKERGGFRSSWRRCQVAAGGGIFIFSVVAAKDVLTGAAHGSRGRVL